MGMKAQPPTTDAQHGTGILSLEAFRALIARRGEGILALAIELARQNDPLATLTRPFLGQLLSQTMQLRELLDAYGAGMNKTWHRYRSLVSSGNRFGGVHYLLKHIRYAIPGYRLLPVEGDFATATEQALLFTGSVLTRMAHALVAQAEQLGLPQPSESPHVEQYSEVLPTGRLPHDRTTRAVVSAKAAITHLASAFLEQAAESDLLHVPKNLQPEAYATYVPDKINEQQLRRLTDKYHNLQAMYDTNVAETRTESFDADLPVLRGHISVIFHLLEIATDLSHFYERHMEANSIDADATRRLGCIDQDQLLLTLMDYAIAYSSRYLERARDLCQEMLKRYAEVGRVSVSAPRYRGFHVRPSTLVAKTVLHYGSDVKMEIDGETFNANSPMDIFRANEKISARKRRWLQAEVGKLGLATKLHDGEEIEEVVRQAVLELAEQGKVVIYQRPIPITCGDDDEGMTLTERVSREVGRLQATGAIDIDTEIEVSFFGDRRVLADLELLAENDYGEDAFGNNIELPKKLTYLRR